LNWIQLLGDKNQLNCVQLDKLNGLIIQFNDHLIMGVVHVKMSMKFSQTTFMYICQTLVEFEQVACHIKEFFGVILL